MRYLVAALLVIAVITALFYPVGIMWNLGPYIGTCVLNVGWVLFLIALLLPSKDKQLRKNEDDKA